MGQGNVNIQMSGPGQLAVCEKSTSGYIVSYGTRYRQCSDRELLHNCEGRHAVSDGDIVSSWDFAPPGHRMLN